MARTNIAAQTLPGAYPTLPPAANSLDLTTVAADIANGNETAIVDNKTVVLAKNDDVGAVTITFTSVADTLGRTGDITAYSIGAGELAVFGPFKLVGWTHSGKLWIDGSDVDLKLAVITLP
jgi:hypothetical protein